MYLKFSPDIVEDLKAIKKRDAVLFRRIQKQLKLFQQSPTHHSLRLHKLSGNLQNLWSISINKSIRIVYIVLENNEAYFVAIGTHDQVYK
ncbi:type II toxin-antitoxin system mRNA interferase toxin, RelE/StbE family [Candidatus Roizmanbacteria bacterium]|nr:type II toxin-antitoxin system mRNA interferase toxin, RelE/StbE family [Candidatus Roizmanbacteria bacterium]